MWNYKSLSKIHTNYQIHDLICYAIFVLTSPLYETFHWTMQSHIATASLPSFDLKNLLLYLTNCHDQVIC